MNIGKRIKRLREDREWTQDDLAGRMGYKSRAAINRIESGINDVSTKKVKKFADIFGVSVEYLMGWESPEEPTAKTRADANATQWREEFGDTGFSPEEMNQLIDYAKYLLSRRKTK